MISEPSTEQRVKFLLAELVRGDFTRVAQMVYSDGSYPTDVRLAVAKSVKAELEIEVSEITSGNRKDIEKIYWINAMSALLEQLPAMDS